MNKKHSHEKNIGPAHIGGFSKSVGQPRKKDVYAVTWKSKGNWPHKMEQKEIG
jgi:hypothetical protein